MKTHDFWYDLPEELIAQTPLEKRDNSRLLVLDRVIPVAESGIVNASRYRCRTIPTAGALLKEEDSLEKQTSFEV